MDWSEQSVEQRIVTAIKHHKKAIDRLTGGRGLTHKDYKENQDLRARFNEHDLVIRVLESLQFKGHPEIHGFKRVVK